jgi:hypothetical protein
MRLKKFRSELPFKKRFLAKSLREDREIKRLAHASRALSLLYESLLLEEEDDSDSDSDSDSDLEDELEETELALALTRKELARVAIEDPYVQQSYPPRNRDINSFAEGDIDHLFRFRKREDIRRLLAVWQLPETIKINNIRVRSEEVFLFSLRRVSCLNTLHSLALDEFGRDWSFWSKAFNWMLRWTFEKFAHKLDHRCLRFFERRFPQYAVGVAQVVNAKGPCNFVLELFRVMGFIDCNNTGVARAIFFHSSVFFPYSVVLSRKDFWTALASANSVVAFQTILSALCFSDLSAPCWPPARIDTLKSPSSMIFHGGST